MKGFDLSSQPMDDSEHAPGVSPFELGDLPESHRRVMRLLLANTVMTYPQICDAFTALPEAERISIADLDATLDELSNEGRLTRVGDGTPVTYRAVVRSKSPSTLSIDLWAALDEPAEKESSEGTSDASP